MFEVAKVLKLTLFSVRSLQSLTPAFSQISPVTRSFLSKFWQQVLRRQRTRLKARCSFTCKFSSIILVLKNISAEIYNFRTSSIKVNRQQPRSARLRPIQKIPTPIKFLISPLPEMINQICKKYSLVNSQDKKTSDDT